VVSGGGAGAAPSPPSAGRSSEPRRSPPGEGSGRGAARPAGRYLPRKRDGDSGDPPSPHPFPRHSPLPTAAPAPLSARRGPAPPSPAAGRYAPPPRRAGGGGGRRPEPPRRPLPPASHMQRAGAARRRPPPALPAGRVRGGVGGAGGEDGDLGGAGREFPGRLAPLRAAGWAGRAGEGRGQRRRPGGGEGGCRCPSARSMHRPPLLRRRGAFKPSLRAAAAAPPARPAPAREPPRRGGRSGASRRAVPRTPVKHRPRAGVSVGRGMGSCCAEPGPRVLPEPAGPPHLLRCFSRLRSLRRLPATRRSARVAGRSLGGCPELCAWHLRRPRRGVESRSRKLV